MAVSLPVVAERLALRSASSRLEVDRAAGARAVSTARSRADSANAHVAVGAPGQELEGRLLHLGWVVQAALGVPGSARPEGGGCPPSRAAPARESSAELFEVGVLTSSRR